MRLLAHPGASESSRAGCDRSLRTPLARAFLALAPALLLAGVGCGGSPTAPRQDEVFYLHGSVINQDESWEVYFKPLDMEATPRVPRIVGVGLMRGDIRMGRPVDWYIRSADYTPGQRFISYQSPRQFIFSIFERVDHPEDPWVDVMRRYEDDLDDQGGTVLSGRVPVSTANAQGRSYFVKTVVAAKPPYQSFAHEILLRSDRRILLVQIVHSENIEAASDEMVAALQSMIVY